MNISELKKLLASQSMAQQWSPSDDQVKRIALKIADDVSKGKRITRPHLQGVITEVCGRTTFIINDSVDNSDLNAVLMAAINKQ